jgi:hypothetical protein
MRSYPLALRRHFLPVLAAVVVLVLHACNNVHRGCNCPKWSQVEELDATGGSAECEAPDNNLAHAPTI